MLVTKKGKSMLSKTYVQACLAGDANIFDLDDYIDYWHDNDTGVTLREFLGLPLYEYQEWGKIVTVYLEIS